MSEPSKEAMEQWPTDVLCRLLLPVPMQAIGAIATALGAVARKAGMDARMRQVGNVLEIFTVPNDQARVGEEKP
jgi:alkylated DNA nucleotide flippase Atl1